MTEPNKEPISARDIANDLKKTMDDTRSFARERLTEGKHMVGDYSTRAKEKMGEYSDIAREKASEYAYAAREKAGEVKEMSEVYIKDNPWKAVFGALGVGLVVGLILG